MRRRFLSRKEIRRRLEALEARLGQPTPPPLDGQQALDIPPPSARITVPTLPGLEEAGIQRAAERLEEQP